MVLLGYHTGWASFATHYAPVSTQSAYNSTAGLAVQPWAVAGTVTNAVLRLAAAPGVGKSWTFTLAVAGSATALSVTISDTATTGRDTTHTASVAAGDSLAWQVTNSGAPATTTATSALEFTSLAAGESGYGRGPLAGTAGTSYSTVFGAGTVLHATAGLATEVVAVAGTITATALLAWSATPPGVGGCTLTLIKNGVLQDGTAGSVNTAVGYTTSGITASGTFSLPVAVGDQICYQVVMSGSPYVGHATRFVATTPGEALLGGGTLNTLNTVTTYDRLTSAEGSSWSGAEGGSLLVGGVTALTLDRCQLVLHVAPGGATARTLSVRRNAASPAGTPSVTIAGAATTGADATGSVAVVDGDTLELRHVPTGAPANGGGRWVFRQRSGAIAAGPAPSAQPYVWGPL